MSEKTCETCRWFFPITSELFEDPAGQCLLAPPMGGFHSYPIREVTFTTTRPVTYSILTCAEHQPKDKADE